MLQLGIAFPADASSTQWLPDQFKLETGTVVSAGGSSALKPNNAGVLTLTFPVTGQSLDNQHLLRLIFEGPSPQRFLIFWQSDTVAGKLFHVEVAPPASGTSTLDLAEFTGWEGNAEILGIEFRLLPGQQLKLSNVALSSLSLVDAMKNYWYHWTVNRYWRHAEINRVTGTVDADAGPYPVPFFAGLTALALALLVFFRAARRDKGAFNWQVAGAIILCIWILSDSFWQLRLWRQAWATWDTFGGKTTQEKLLVSAHANLVGFTQQAKHHIQNSDARIFIASSGDDIGMVSAYFMAPFNTYWHRGGPELPAGDSFVSGDYILVVAPSGVEVDLDLDLDSGTLRYAGEAGLKVSVEYDSASGALLKVM